MSKFPKIKKRGAVRGFLGVWILKLGVFPGLVISSAADSGQFPRPPADILEAQVALARRNISSGPIDGKFGAQTRAALIAFQEEQSLDATGRLNGETRAALALAAPPVTTRIVTAADLASLHPVPPTWLGKSQQPSLAYATALEMAAEQSRAHPALLRQLNPGMIWEKIEPGTIIAIPDTGPGTRAATIRAGEKAARIIISLGEHTLQARADDGRLLAHFPVSIARKIEKRPVGTLRVKTIAPNPNYTFDPEIFTESEEARELGRKLIIPPGPNNPVGLVWIGLDKSGYGIHGTPEPEKVGRTESHGCFRLANWDALALVELVEIDTEVIVLP
ncbi:lipoprotein-anchoring transpeptidase ErfK/SrfK [Ereboglobus sp. PH5-5]|nr:lipoprotein-anchoring transpeptidase ErfK/SrfK [Ereboglobus sp. PH5-5]